MRYWKKMVAGGAAMLISAGAAHAGQEPSAVEQADRSMDAARQQMGGDAKGGTSFDAYRAKSDAGLNGDGSGFVTHDELDKLSKELLERVERERNPPTPPPTFTDHG